MASKKDEPTGGFAPDEPVPQSAAPDQPMASEGRPTERAAQRAARSGEDMMNRSVEAGRQTTEQTAQLADRGLRQAADMARQQSEQASNFLTSSSEAYRDLAEYSRADFDAILQSSARLAQGLQEMGWQMTNLTQESLRMGMRLANDLLGCRTMEDVVAAQRDFVKESVEAMLSGSQRLMSMSSRMASDAANPIGERVGNDGPSGEGDRRAATQGEDAPRGPASRARESGGREYRH